MAPSRDESLTASRQGRGSRRRRPRRPPAPLDLAHALASVGGATLPVLLLAGGFDAFLTPSLGGESDHPWAIAIPFPGWPLASLVSFGCVLQSVCRDAAPYPLAALASVLGFLLSQLVFLRSLALLAGLAIGA